MENFDLETFVDLFDTAMSSDNPTVRKAFKNLMMVAALVEGENQDPKIGPLRGLLKTVENLQQKVTVLEMNQYKSSNMNKAYGPTITTTPYTPSMPTWVAPTYTYTVGTGGAVGTGSNGAGGAGGSTTTISNFNNNMSYVLDPSKLETLYGNLETK